MKKVAIVGVEGSGKTVMLAGLGDLYTYPDEEGYFLAPKNFGTAAYVAEKIERMRKGEWPVATAGDEVRGLDWTLKRHKEGVEGRPETICEVSFLDFAGEVYRAAYGISGGGDASLREQAEELKRYVCGADELIVLINLRDVILHGFRDTREQEAMWITKSILDTALGDGSGDKSPRAAIVFSQADNYAATINACGSPRGMLKKYLPHVANDYGWLDVFAANAVDKIALDDDGNVVPAADFTTQGLLPIMQWIRGEKVGRCDMPDGGCASNGRRLSRPEAPTVLSPVPLAPEPVRPPISPEPKDDDLTPIPPPPPPPIDDLQPIPPPAPPEETKPMESVPTADGAHAPSNEQGQETSVAGSGETDSVAENSPSPGVSVDGKCADVVFVIDASGSMRECFDQLRTNIRKFVEPFREEGFDSLRLGLLAYSANIDRMAKKCIYRNIVIGGEGATAMKSLYGQVPPREELFFTCSKNGAADTDSFMRRLDGVRCKGDEDTVFALDCAADFPYGPLESTRRVVVLFTDEKIEDGVLKQESVGEKFSQVEKVMKKIVDRHISLYVFAPTSPVTDMMSEFSRVFLTNVPEFRPEATDTWANIDFARVLEMMGKSVSSSLSGGCERDFSRAIFGQNAWEDDRWA
ncbi:MAG: VWA domain-containing protein [Kiritimatiellae bacterium]|nr:VWA domain-containing protein [Kiritimatiellia bacterium]